MKITKLNYNIPEIANFTLNPKALIFLNDHIKINVNPDNKLLDIYSYPINSNNVYLLMLIYLLL